MVTAADLAKSGGALNSNLGTASNIMGILDKFLGSKGSTNTTTQSGGDRTEQTMLSPEAINEILKNLLGGTQGLAATASGQRKAGLYNSTSNSILTSNLLSRAAGQAALVSAPKVTRATPTQTTQTAGAQKGLLGGGLGSLLGIGALAMNKDVQKGAKGLFDWGTNSLFDGGVFNVPGGLTENIFDVPSGVASGAISAAEMLGISPSVASDFGIGNAASLSGFITSNPVTSLIDSISGSAGDTVLSGGAMADTIDAVTSAGGEAWDMRADAGGDWMIDTGTELGDIGIPGVGSAINFITGNNAGGKAGEGVVLSMIPGVGPIAALANALDVPVVSDVVDVSGDAVKEAGDFIGGAVSDIVDFVSGGGCFITTAICKTLGLPDDCFELNTLRRYRDTWLKDNHPEDIEKYYAEAPALVAKIDLFSSSAEIWKSLYSHYIVPALVYVQNNENIAAYNCYRDLFTTVKRLASGEGK